jgi:hypothetical protein
VIFAFLQFLDSRGIDVGETPNDITLVLTMKLLSPRVRQPCYPEKKLHAWIAPLTTAKIGQRKCEYMNRTEMGYNDVQTVNY